VPIFLCKKITKPKCNYRKAVESIFVQKILEYNADEIDSWQKGFTTYLGPLKKYCPKLSQNFVCQKWPKTVQVSISSTFLQRNQILTFVTRLIEFLIRVLF